MNKPVLSSKVGHLPSKAHKAGCEAIYLPDEDDSSPGQWVFHQNYNQGILWNRLSLPWLVAHSNIHYSHSPIRSFIKQVKNAELYLRDVHPGVQIPQDLLKEHLRDSVKQTDRPFDPYQGELLGLGVTRIFLNAATRQKLPSRWNEYFVVFPSGMMRSNISAASIQWKTKEVEGGGIRAPCLGEIFTLKFPFPTQIEQIVFPTIAKDGLFSDFFAVRTISQVTILTCCRTGEGQISVESCFTLPEPMSRNTSCQAIADMTFDTMGSKAITITDRGFWTCYDLFTSNGGATESSSGRIELSLTENREIRGGRWKMEWIDYTEEVLIAGSNGLYLLDLASAQSRTILNVDDGQQCIGLSRLQGLKSTCYGILTTTEIIIIDTTEWDIMLRQKHRRDADISLCMKTFFKEGVTNILIYSRLNAVITVHQLVEDITLTWADTPSLLPVPRFENNSMKPMPNFGLILIPSERILNAQDPDSSEIASFTTYRLTSDFNTVGDMYAKEADSVYDLTEFGVDPGKNRKSVSSNPDSDSEGSSDDWDSGRNRKLDFAEVAKIIIPAMSSTEVTPQVALQQLKGNILHQIESTQDLPFQTMLPAKSPDMELMHLDELTSTIEQIAHQLEENGMRIRHLQVSTTPDDDPENDTGSISSIYNALLSAFPNHGLTTKEVRSKVQSIRETAIDVGLSNIGVLKPFSNTDPNNVSLHNLREFVYIDKGIQLSDAARHLLKKWDEPTRPEPVQFKSVLKRRRVHMTASQEDIVVNTPKATRGRELAQMTMSQPERGRHGIRNLKPRPRRSGF